MVFGNGVKNIQAAAYNGERTVHITIKTTCVKCGRLFYLLVIFENGKDHARLLIAVIQFITV